MSHDAIIIGGGPAGASAALALARQGRAVAIVERHAFPRRKVCGEFISAVNLPLFDDLGVSAAFRAAAGPEVRRLALFAAGPGVEGAMPPAADGGYGRALGRDVLDGLLLEAAKCAGADVFQPWRATSLTRAAGCSEVVIEAEGESRTLAAPVIVAAHGSWETGRLPSNLEKQNRPGDFLGFKAHFSGARMAADLMPLLAFPGGYGGMVWADGGRLSLSCCIRRDALARIRAAHPDLAAGPAVEAHIRASCPATLAVLRDAQLAGEWLAAGPIRPGIRAAYEGGIFRAGNIAGESHPIIAEGISMALQSGWLLARELGRLEIWNEQAQAEAGRRYQAAWRRQFATRIRVASVLSRLAIAPPSAALMAWVVERLPGSLSLGARLSGKVMPLMP
jgi:flavin-dependent dehydrogenase